MFRVEVEMCPVFISISFHQLKRRELVSFSLQFFLLFKTNKKIRNCHKVELSPKAKYV